MLPSKNSIADKDAVSPFSICEQSEQIPPLKRGATKSGGFPATGFKSRHLIFNGRHLPYNPENTDNARSLRKNSTPEEKKLWDGFLRKHPLRFLRQKPVDHYILDFYCAKLRLGIEIDGSQHYSANARKYDTIRTDILSVFGVKILRFTNNDVNKNFKGVCHAIQEEVLKLDKHV